jgi:tetratricopeptide (TPR) repeat protein
MQPKDDYVMFLTGRVATNDGSPTPTGMMVERVCSGRVRQQVYPSAHGDFSMQLGSPTDSFVDASGDPMSRYDRTSKNPNMGIPRRDLANCELRASGAGFHSRSIYLVEVTTYNGGMDTNVDVGAIVLQRTGKAKGGTVSATPYQVPKDARKAFAKGVEAEKNGQLPDARGYYQQAVNIYPRYANAWFRLGRVLQTNNQKEEARTAYAQATSIDSKFLAPYLSLAFLAYQDNQWKDVLDYTRHISDLDALNYNSVTGYILDLDSASFAESYFYNSVANYRLNRIPEAEKSALRAERLDLRMHFPQVHLLLADIYAGRGDYSAAIPQIQNYLELAPEGKGAPEARQRLAEMQKLSLASPLEKPKQD